MTKKHFIELADIIKNIKPTIDTSSNGNFVVPSTYQFALNQWEKNILKFADFCKAQNVNFNRERWISYIKGECGVNGGRI